jgi:thiamine pyrophosphate-dependent acetolactate synthase large subunit-like protein
MVKMTFIIQERDVSPEDAFEAIQDHIEVWHDLIDAKMEALPEKVEEVKPLLKSSKKPITYLGYGADYWCSECEEDCVFCQDFSSSPKLHPTRDR